jgi:hypothetical protein
MFDPIAGLPPLVVFEMVGRLFPYQHRLIDFPICQNPPHVHAHKGHVCSSYSLGYDLMWIVYFSL